MPADGQERRPTRRRRGWGAEIVEGAQEAQATSCVNEILLWPFETRHSLINRGSRPAA